METDDTATPKPDCALTLVTPDTAKRWLTKNTRNRALKMKRVEKYARDMKNGNWVITGEALKFGADGSLLDGQNRLQAVVKADASVYMLVVRGLPVEAQLVMDSGATRSTADGLALNGEKYSKLLAATARLAIEYDALGSVSGAIQPSNSEVYAYIEANHGVREAAQFTYSSELRTIPCTPAVRAFTYFALSRIDAFEANEFYVSWAKMTGLPPGSPIAALNGQMVRRTRGARIANTSAVALIFRAWNANRTGRTYGRPSDLREMTNDKGAIVIPKPV